MLFSLPLVTILAVLNATIGEQSLPIEVTTATSAAEAATAAPVTLGGFAVDAATLTAVAGIAGGAWAAFRKSSGRENATADTTLKVADSVKATDYGAADTANILAESLAALSNVNPEIKSALSQSSQRARENASRWQQDNKEYYENIATAPRKGELEGDKVKTKLAQVNKITEPTPDP